MARSFVQSGSVVRWTLARAFRLFPALAVVLLLSVVALGPLVTDLPLAVYAADPDAWTYLPRNLTLAFGQRDLPGVFLENVYEETVNGSLWTLFFEVTWYGAVLGLGVLGLLSSKLRFALCAAAFLAAYIALVVLGDAADLPYRVRHVLGFGLPFMIGMTFFVFRDSLTLRPLVLAGLVLLCAALSESAFVRPLQALTLCYGVFVAAFLITGPIRRYNLLGDYSYGVYLYAFPVQQTVTHYSGGGDPIFNVMLSVPITLFFAILSWKLVEKPALNLLRRQGSFGAYLPGLRRPRPEGDEVRPSVR